MRRLIAIMLALAATLVRPSHAADGASAPVARRVQAAGATLTVTPSADSVRAGQPLRQLFIARRQSYHGNTLGALAIGGNGRSTVASDHPAKRNRTEGEVLRRSRRPERCAGHR